MFKCLCNNCSLIHPAGFFLLKHICSPVRGTLRHFKKKKKVFVSENVSFKLPIPSMLMSVDSCAFPPFVDHQ